MKGKGERDREERGECSTYRSQPFAVAAWPIHVRTHSETFCACTPAKVATRKATAGTSENFMLFWRAGRGGGGDAGGLVGGMAVSWENRGGHDRRRL